MVEIPPEMLEKMGLKVGQDVMLTYAEDAIRMEPSVPQPSPDAVKFASRFTKKYEEAMRNLAQR